MPKRFHDTDIWQEDWFIILPKDYQHFWFYLKDNCDHAGIWRPKIKGFNKLFDCDIDLKDMRFNCTREDVYTIHESEK